MKRFISKIRGYDVMLILFGFLAGGVTVAFLASLRAGGATASAWVGAFARDVAIILLGVGVAYVLIAIVLERQQRDVSRKRLEALKSQAINQLGSGDNEAAKHAAEELRAHGWLSDGSLEGIRLVNANLEHCDLSVANLAKANLEAANLTHASLHGANLYKAILINVNLRQANLIAANLVQSHLKNANLERAILALANLEDADMEGANLDGANLSHANLRAARLDRAQFSAKTVLPDGTHWEAGADLARFADAAHAHFWRSEHGDSPAGQA